MRITTTMMTNNILLSLNRNRATMSNLEEQMSTGKKIQKPSDDPIVAARALKFRTNLSEIDQYKTNSEDAKSWLSVSEQAVDNSHSILNRIRELAVQGSSGVLSTSDRSNMTAEIEQLRDQLASEGNASYAGRHVFTGYQTDKSLVYEADDTSKTYELTEHFTSDDMEKVQRVYGNEINDTYRIRLGYKEVLEAGVPGTIAGYTVTSMDSSESLSSTPPGTYEAYNPPVNEVYFLKDTGELIFNQANVEATTAPTLPGDPELIPATIDFNYDKDTFYKGDLRPDHYFESTYTDASGTYNFLPDEEAMNYQVSYSQSLQVNVMGSDVISVDMMRDLDELVDDVKNINYDDSLGDELQQDLLVSRFNETIGNMDDHLFDLSNVQAVIGGKINRLDLTLSRLDEDKLNFTDLLSKNEDVDMAETLIKFSSQEVVYNAALSSSSKIIQPTLLDFIR